MDENIRFQLSVFLSDAWCDVSKTSDREFARLLYLKFREMQEELDKLRQFRRTVSNAVSDLEP